MRPYAKGGSSGEENLRVLCRGHNLLSASLEFGEAFMRGKIEGRGVSRVAGISPAYFDEMRQL